MITVCNTSREGSQGVPNLLTFKTMESKRSSTSVKVTNYPDQDDSNPEPVSIPLDAITNGFLSPHTLKALTGTTNLNDLTSLQLSVNAQETSIGSMGGMVPQLSRLRLVDSFVPSVRDLGTGFSNLQYLWLSRCGLEDLDGISCFSCIQELYLSYNEISDLSPLSLLEMLQVLDLEGNNVNDIAQVEFLAFCSNLKSLVLDGNPIAKAPSPDCLEEDLALYNYRAAVVEALPSLKYLDDEAVAFEFIDGKKVVKRKEKSLDREGIIIQDSIKYSDIIEEEDSDEDEVCSIPMTRPRSAVGSGRPSSAAARNRPLSAAKTRRPPSASITGRPASAASKARPSSAARTGRPMSAMGGVFDNMTERPRTASRPSTASGTRSPGNVDYAGLSSHSSSENLDEDGSSDLTHGSKKVLCGNPVRALLARRKELIGSLRTQQTESSQVDTSTTADRFVQDSSTRFIPERSYYSKEEEIQSDDNVLQELKEWRRKFSRRLDDSDDNTSPSPAQDSKRSEISGSPTSISPAPPPCRPKKAFETPQPQMPSRIFPNGDIVERPSTVSSFRSRRYKPGRSGDNSRENSNSPTFGASPEMGWLEDRPNTALFTRPTPPNRFPVQKRPSLSPKSRLGKESNNNYAGSLGDNGAETRPVTAMAALQRTRLRQEK